ncbi:MAG: 30S ribosomal protein S3 [candidate division Zixibacteria bacterium]|nr:30S ribosomal protein S3 [candidate division Zixibacteria bacterium]
MGQKTHPIGFRLGVIKTWNSRWFAGKKFPELLQEDMLIRRYTSKRLEHAGLSRIEILRAPKRVTVDIHTAKPGIVIGRKGAEVDKLREELQMLTGKEILLNIIEVKKPEVDAALVADSIAKQLEGRISFRRAMKKALSSAMKMGAEGIKILCSGRLGGAEIARSEKYHQGRVPLHTLRADIDYATATANTTYGCIGVKVWICKGEVLGTPEEETEEFQRPDKKRPPKRAEGKKPPKPRRRRRRRKPRTDGEDSVDSRHAGPGYSGAPKGDKPTSPPEARQRKAEPDKKSAPASKSEDKKDVKKESDDVNAKED